MIKTEIVTIRDKQYQRTWSDVGMMIERNGARYSEAVDPLNSGRTYTETDEPIEQEINLSELVGLYVEEV